MAFYFIETYDIDNFSVLASQLRTYENIIPTETISPFSQILSGLPASV